MNILLVSQCSKNALKNTRRIIDQFAERCGDRTWRTPMTEIGIKTLRKVLKQNARKNTAVACHWIRGKYQSELLWIVGNSGRFSPEGAVPTNFTLKDVLRCEDENGWHTLEVISLLAAIAGLFHDFGKANQLFQQKLKPCHKGKSFEPIRHEWISLRLFQAFVNDATDHEWLQRLQKASPEMEKELMRVLIKDQDSVSLFCKWNPSPLVKSIVWLILSHHRLPEFSKHKPPEKQPRGDEMDSWMKKALDTDWNSPQISKEWKEEEWRALWRFPNGTPLRSRSWCERAQNVGERALLHPKLLQGEWLEDRFTIHLARLTLMVSDHCYSSSNPTVEWQDTSYDCIANTDRTSGAPKQKLDEHNIGVSEDALKIAKWLPRCRKGLPAITRMRALKKRSSNEQFRWQDKAYEMARSLSVQSERHGFFGVNMASTGCGKTFANARIMYGLADERRGCRFSVALGLRTLTLQTGDALREKLSLDEEDIAVLIGSQAVQELHERRNDDHSPTSSESESLEEPLDESQHLTYEGALADTQLGRWLKRSPKLHRLVSAPVLVSTIDYLILATEGARGGRQIAPMLRLLTADLVLDEPDDFDLDDLPALCRLVNWAGLLGSRVLLSSATLPPSLIQALFEAYATGRRQFKGGSEPSEQSSQILCGWIDEFTAVSSMHESKEDFQEAHQAFVDKRIQQIKHEKRRCGKLIPVESTSTKSEDVVAEVASVIRANIFDLHEQHHTVHPFGGQKVSFGLVRFANIRPMVAVVRQLLNHSLPSDYRLHFCVYHSQYPMMMRSAIESVIDRMLDRREEVAIWSHPSIIEALTNHRERNHLFVVFGTPVTEVGRDHDYDWAIAEPSSMRSLIQLAGRIQRHRHTSVEVPNFLILTKNIRALRSCDLAYRWPGFEAKGFTLEDKDLTLALEEHQYRTINAIPRISHDTTLCCSKNLAALEHAHLSARLFTLPLHASLWWEQNPTWSSEFQRQTRFRASAEQDSFVLVQEEGGGTTWKQWLPQGGLGPIENLFNRIEFNYHEQATPWIDTNPAKLIKEWITDDEPDLEGLSKRYFQVELRTQKEGRWNYNDLLGVFDDL